MIRNAHNPGFRVFQKLFYFLCLAQYCMVVGIIRCIVGKTAVAVTIKNNRRSALTTSALLKASAVSINLWHGGHSSHHGSGTAASVWKSPQAGPSNGPNDFTYASVNIQIPAAATPAQTQFVYVPREKVLKIFSGNCLLVGLTTVEKLKRLAGVCVTRWVPEQFYSRYGNRWEVGNALYGHP